MADDDYNEATEVRSDTFESDAQAQDFADEDEIVRTEGEAED